MLKLSVVTFACFTLVGCADARRRWPAQRRHSPLGPLSAGGLPALPA